jgi:aminoglycoside 6'-N-acetyltransferase I
MRVETRRLGPGDEPLLDHVADEVFDEPLDDGLLRAFLAEPTHCLLVALHDGEVVGQATAMLHRHPAGPPDLYVDELAVTPALQRHGIGRALLAEARAVGRSLGCRQVWLAAEAEDGAARAFYAAQGSTEQPAVVCTFAAD